MSLRVIVVDDSIIFRKVIRDCLATIDDVEVVDIAKDGLVALEKIRNHKPDLVTLDVAMPGLDGLGVLKQIQKEGIATHVIMVSSHTRCNAASTTQALEVGALDFILKPNHQDSADNVSQLKGQLSSRIDLLRRHQCQPKTNRNKATEASNIELTDGPPAPRSTTSRLELGTESAGRSDDLELDAICIGISTGGPRALATLIPSLKPSLDVPIFMVQHMPPLFTASMAEALDAQSQLNVVEAADGMPVTRGNVYIAPGGKQTRIMGHPGAWLMQVTDEAPVRGCRPSVDLLFESASSQFGKRLLGIVMTGMGDDGLAGSREIVRRGGSVWAQDEDSSTVFGMPRAVVEAGVASEIRSLQEIGAGINRYAQRPSLSITNT